MEYFILLWFTHGPINYFFDWFPLNILSNSRWIPVKFPSEQGNIPFTITSESDIDNDVYKENIGHLALSGAMMMEGAEHISYSLAMAEICV